MIRIAAAPTKPTPRPSRDGPLPWRAHRLVPGLEEQSHSPKRLLFHPPGHFSEDIRSQTDVLGSTKISGRGSRSAERSRPVPTLTGISSDHASKRSLHTATCPSGGTVRSICFTFARDFQSNE